MIAYQEYNTKSPLNGLAAKWAAQNSHLLPVDSRPIAPPLKANDPQEIQVETALSHVAYPVELPQTTEDPWAQKITIE
jgi:hypothetical protein